MKWAVAVIGLALISIGPAALLIPDRAASAYGIPAETPSARAYLLAAGVRDVALGIWLLALLRLGAGNRVLAVSLFALGVVAAGDAAIVLANGGSQRGWAMGVHLGGLAVLLVLGRRFWVSRE
jgi:hypothetical protein